MLKIIICIYTAKIIVDVINLYLENRLNIFLNLEKCIGDKYLLVIDKAPSHVSYESLELLKNNNLNYYLIPSGMYSLLQPMELSVNKIFKDNLRYLF